MEIMNHKQLFLESLDQRLESINNQLKVPQYLTSMVIECMNEERDEILVILKKGK